MRSQFARRLTFSLAVLLALGLCFDEAGAQRRRTRRSRRATNPVVTRTRPVVTPTPSTADPQIISTAEQQAVEEEAGVQPTTTPTPARRTTRRAPVALEEDRDAVRRTVNDLSAQVTKLSEKLSQMEQQQRTLVDLERLSRAEQRAEALHAQVIGVQEKETNLTARLEQIEFDLRPENIERSVASYGSTRPEDAREARRRGLETEKSLLRSQLDTIRSSRLRLESAIATADAEVDRLRKRIDDAEPRPDDAANGVDTDATETTTTTTTEPSPDNPQR